MNAAVVFDKVSKSYPMYHHITGGIKNLIFHLPQGIRSIKRTRYEVFHELSFEIKKGETFGIIGRNGVGKSTILGLIAGVLRQSQGTIVVNGRISPLLELGAGFHPDLSGRENIILNGVLMGLTREEIFKRVNDIIMFSGLDQFIDQPVRVYSSGMLTRLGFSVVAHLEPEILLIDEILAVGDIDFQKKCLERMAEFKKNNVTIIFVSHSMLNVERICDRVMWMESCTQKMIGSTNIVVKAYKEHE
ncbi:MAG: sugar ABC transporter ATP-binding protein [Syntrophus sp. (in: bacteria)]|nr:sugar ABC transporter ATP-binding protein [Syntrophus sp. (in: bacteria)]